MIFMVSYPVPIPYCSLDELNFSLEELGFLPSVLTTIMAVEQAYQGEVRYHGVSTLEQHVYPVTMATMAYLVMEQTYVDPNCIKAALLHDAMNDDLSLTPDVFQATFGDEAFKLIKPLILPNIDSFEGTETDKREISMEIYLTNLYNSEFESKVIAMACAHNKLLCLPVIPDAGLQQRIIMDTSTYFIPFAKQNVPIYATKLLETFQKLG